MTNTKTLFSALARLLDADCICDIGSRDGKQSVLFRKLCPAARVLAFEANPVNAKLMRANPALKQERIEIHELAVADRDGFMDFHVTSVTDPNQDERDFGCSSLLPRVGEAAKDFVPAGTTKVPVRRIDDVLRETCPNASRIALWIDAEGAEYMILSGMAGIADKVYVLHVETAVRPLFAEQKPYPEVAKLLKAHGLVPCGDNITEAAGWGDVVFVREEWAKTIGPAFNKAKSKARRAQIFRVDDIAANLKAKWPWLYRTLHRVYVKNI